MKFEDKLKKLPAEAVWQEYCGFLDLSIDEYMQIQLRLMEEQISIWSACPLGKKLLSGQTPKTVEEFRRMLPLTTFSDYADVLLQKRAELLPDAPVIWIETTWEGGRHPVKLAPYTRGMLEVYRSNVIASLILCTSSKRGRFTVRPGDKTLYGFAPLPYATGLFPLLLEEEISLKYLPSLKDGKSMSFGQRNKEGFKLGLNSGIDLFFGMSSVVSYITESFAESGAAKSSPRPVKPIQNGKKTDVIHMTMSMLRRYLTSKYRSKRDGVPMKPKDLFHLKGFVCAGTDTACYKDFLEDTWGIRPMEIAAGTEPTIIGTETWNRDGMVLFPDACFYEFIPEPEMLKSLDDPSYAPRTVLLNELEENRSYELVISVLKGGAFARYRVGDVYRCVSTGCEKRDDGVRLPRLSFVDRVPTVIDIAGFTRITEPMIAEVISLSGLPVADWLAAKQFNADRRPFLHLYIEMKKEALESFAVSQQILVEHLSVYFKCFDSDYNDLKRLLGIDPLQITILRSGTMAAYRRAGYEIRRINPPALALSTLLSLQNKVPNFPAFVAQGGVSHD